MAEPAVDLSELQPHHSRGWIRMSDTSPPQYCGAVVPVSETQGAIVARRVVRGIFPEQTVERRLTGVPADVGLIHNCNLCPPAPDDTVQQALGGTPP